MFRFKYSLSKDPYIFQNSVLVVVSACILALGLYTIGPWYVGGPTTAMGIVLEDDLIRAIPSALYVLSGIGGITGALSDSLNHRYRLVYRSSFLISTSFAFVSILRILTFGFTPVTWILSLALSLISAIIFLWESGRGDRV